MKFLIYSASTIFILLSTSATFADSCVYMTRSGKIRSAPSIADVPEKYREKARCKKSNQHMAKPQEITLDGNVRREIFNSPLGEIKLRWPRSVESIFGTTPVRAMVESSRTVSRVIRSSSFPSEFQNMNVEWNVVFMDENMKSNEVPTTLMSRCHPGWMTPPANIYIVAQRVAEGCGKTENISASVADKRLTKTLVHEMAHAFEAYMLKDMFIKERLRAEGFATWFTSYAASSSSILNQSEIRQRLVRIGLQTLKSAKRTQSFSGSYQDYQKAALHFLAIENRYGLNGIARLYEAMARDKTLFIPTIDRQFYWNQKKLLKEMLKLEGSY